MTNPYLMQGGLSIAFHYDKLDRVSSLSIVVDRMPGISDRLEAGILGSEP